MRKIPFIALIICMMSSVLPVMAQDTQVELPWLPYRDTNNTRTVRFFIVKAITGERNLIHTEDYDRKGFFVSPMHKAVYDSHGRLVEYVIMSSVATNEHPKPQIVPIVIYKMKYSIDGVVKRIEEVNYNVYDTVTDTYDLIRHETHPKFGLLDYTFLRTRCNSQSEDKETDTVYYRRQYDEKGHLLSEKVYEGGSYDYGGLFTDIVYSYDKKGRKIAQRKSFNEYSDTLDYHYDRNGVLRGMTGILYNLWAEAKVFITCRPDGTPIEEWQYWTDKGEEGDQEVVHFKYDDHGRVVYKRDSTGASEYKIEYWE